MSEIVTFGGRVASLDREPSDERSTARFLEMVGERVRAARSRKSISRKTLAQISGVSQRYLAQIESGAGNISILLLRRVAEALDHKIEWLVGEEAPCTSEIMSLMSLYRGATSEQRTRVLDILDCQDPGLRRARRLAFIGLRGAGKSTIGRLTADRLGLPFVELNEEIERAIGMPAGEVIALYGQEGYRRLEKQAIERLAATYEELVLAVAGGIVSEAESFNHLLRHYHTIWLSARPEEHMARVRAQGDERPMAGNPAAMEELRNILTSREALYARAEARVNTSRKTIDQTLAEVLLAIERHRFVRP